jgi:hypothetical protein
MILRCNSSESKLIKINSKLEKLEYEKKDLNEAELKDIEI